MSLFNKLNTLAKSIGDATSDAIESNSINSRLSQEKAEVTDILAEIGKIYYGDYKAGVQFNDEILDLMKRVDAHVENVKNLENQRKGINERNQNQGVKCNSCGCNNSDENKFCRECGGSLIPEPVQMKTCLSCGSSVINESVFCGECGTKVE